MIIDCELYIPVYEKSGEKHVCTDSLMLRDLFIYANRTRSNQGKRFGFLSQILRSVSTRICLQSGFCKVGEELDNCDCTVV